MSDRQRVVITGLGQVSALGSSLDALLPQLLVGKAPFSVIEGLDAPGLKRPIGAMIPDWDSRDWMPAGSLKTTWLVTHFAYAAAVQAFESAGLDRTDRPRGGIFLGTGFGGQGASEETYRSCFTTPGRRPRPTAIPNAMANASASFLATELRLTGPNLTLVAACASATHAIGQAFRLLRSGEVDVMLAGGCEAPLTPITMAAWNAMRVLAPAGADPTQACRPFDASRSGLVVGEGAGVLVLETFEHAQRRGAHIYAEVLGYGASADAGHMTRPNIEGVTACMDLALQDAAVEPERIGYLNAHGTGTPINDRTEADAIRRVFSEHSARLMVSSTKAVFGHTMGASGGLEAIATILSLNEGHFPPTANLQTIDAEFPEIAFIKGEARSEDVELAMSSSFGFGGNNAAIVVRNG